MNTEVKNYLANNPAPQSIDVLIVDSNGVLRGKQFPGDQLEGLCKKGANLPISLMFGDVRGATPDALLVPPLVGDPDINYKMVEGSLRPVNCFYEQRTSKETTLLATLLQFWKKSSNV